MPCSSYKKTSESWYTFNVIKNYYIIIELVNYIFIQTSFYVYGFEWFKLSNDFSTWWTYVGCKLIRISWKFEKFIRKIDKPRHFCSSTQITTKVAIAEIIILYKYIYVYV